MSDVRYGVFLRPDPRTCWAVIQLHLALKQQFGLVSAASFAPHSTLVGNLRTDASVDDLSRAVEQALEGIAPFTVHNAGIVRDGDCWIYSIDRGEDGDLNPELHALAAAVKTAILPLNIPVQDHMVTPVVENRFFGHLSLGSHELLVDPRRSDEIGRYLLELPIEPAPSSFVADTVSLFEFTADWAGEWWRDLHWTHLRSWRLS